MAEKTDEHDSRSRMGDEDAVAGRKVIVFFLTVEIIIINYTEANDHDLHI